MSWTVDKLPSIVRRSRFFEMVPLEVSRIQVSSGIVSRGFKDGIEYIDKGVMEPSHGNVVFAFFVQGVRFDSFRLSIESSVHRLSLRPILLAIESLTHRMFTKRYGGDGCIVSIVDDSIAGQGKAMHFFVRDGFPSILYKYKNEPTKREVVRMEIYKA